MKKSTIERIADLIETLAAIRSANATTYADQKTVRTAICAVIKEARNCGTITEDEAIDLAVRYTH